MIVRHVMTHAAITVTGPLQRRAGADVEKNSRATVKQVRYSNPGDALAARTTRDGDCLLWTGAKSGSGYGVIRVNGRNTPAHRVSWERANGAIPDGLFVDHLCFNRACVKVEHLRLATNGQNGANRQGANRTSISGIRGVRFHKHSGLWQSIVIVNRVKHCKYSKTIEEAEQVAIAMRRELMPFSQEPELSHEH